MPPSRRTVPILLLLGALSSLAADLGPDIAMHQDFKTTTFPPRSWTVHSGAGQSWQRMAGPAAAGGAATLGPARQEFALSAWLLSPEIDLEGMATPALSFYDRIDLESSGFNRLEVLVSLDYHGGDPEEATWYALLCRQPHNAQPWRRSTILLDEFRGQRITIAFFGQLDGGDNAWAVDNVWVAEAETLTASPPSVEAYGADGQVALVWRAAGPADHYDVLRAAERHGQYFPVATVPATPHPALAFRDAALVNGLTYWYRIRAVDAKGRSVYYSPLPATPTASWSVIPATLPSTGPVTEIALTRP